MSVRVSPPSLDGPATQPRICICRDPAFSGTDSQRVLVSGLRGFLFSG